MNPICVQYICIKQLGEQGVHESALQAQKCIHLQVSLLIQGVPQQGWLRNRNLLLLPCVAIRYILGLRTIPPLYLLSIFHHWMIQCMMSRYAMPWGENGHNRISHCMQVYKYFQNNQIQKHRCLQGPNRSLPYILLPVGCAFNHSQIVVLAAGAANQGGNI